MEGSFSDFMYEFIVSMFLINAGLFTMRQGVSSDDSVSPILPILQEDIVGGIGWRKAAQFLTIEKLLKFDKIGAIVDTFGRTEERLPSEIFIEMMES